MQMPVRKKWILEGKTYLEEYEKKFDITAGNGDICEKLLLGCYVEVLTWKFSATSYTVIHILIESGSMQVLHTHSYWDKK